MSNKREKIKLMLINEEAVLFNDIKKTKKLFKKKIFSIIFYILLFAFILFLNSIFIYENIFKSNNNNYDKNTTEFNYSKSKEINFQDIQNMADINFIQNFKLKHINQTEVLKYFEFMDFAKKGRYLYPQNIEKIENPKVSVIISIYNRENYVKSTIRSVQNQNMKEIEIIYVDDCSTDNSVRNIKKELKKDPRIFLYENKQNMGALYSKSIGVLFSKGEYIYPLDSDDMFCDENYLNSLYNAAKKRNYKFVYSKALYINLISKKINKKKPYWSVLCKLINADFYRNTIYSVGYNALNKKVNIFDDDVVSQLMIKKASIKWINNAGVSHFIHPGNHIYFRRFSNKESHKKFCLNIVNTIKASYQLLIPKIGISFGNYLLKSQFVWGPCSRFKKDKNVKELLDFYERNKKKKVENETNKVKKNKKIEKKKRRKKNKMIFL